MINLFHRNFDTESELVAARAEAEALAAKGQSPVIAPASYSFDEVEAMLTQARAASFADGKAIGLAEAHAEEQATREARVVEALIAIRDQLEEMSRQDDLRRHEIEVELTELLLGIGERIMPEVMQACTLDQVTARIRTGLGMAAGNTEIVIRVAPDIKDAVADRIAGFGAGGAGRLGADILSDPAMSDSAVRLEWRNGFMEYDLGQACDEVIETLRDSAAKLKAQSGKVT
jgi:flagellar assembly protein FliH